MTIKSLDERIGFIKNLELAEPKKELKSLTKLKLTVTDNDEAAYVDAGSLVSFVAGVSQQHKSDGLNSTLLAQLAANKKFDREQNPVEWYKFYVNVLENIGWVIQQWDFTRFKASGSTFTVESVIADVLAAIATGDDKKIVEETINAVKALDKGDGRLVIWDQNSTSLNKGNFQISACSESDGVLVMKLGAFHFNTSETVTGVLWFQFSTSNTEFFKGGQTVNLNEEVYAQVREAVLTKLGKNAQDFVGNLDI